MNYLSLLRRHYSSKHGTWCYRQGYYQYDKLKKTSQYNHSFVNSWMFLLQMKNLRRNMGQNGIRMKRNG